MVPNEPWMSREDIEALTAWTGDAVTVLEYGAGGSTALFLATGKRVISVESDPVWAAEVAKLAGPLTVFHANVGVTGDCGWPLDMSFQERWPLYWTTPWPCEPDAILVDGRFRVACACWCALQTDAPILIHDWNRKRYHCLLDHLRVAGHADRLVLLKRRFDFIPAHCEATLYRHRMDRW